MKFPRACPNDASGLLSLGTSAVLQYYAVERNRGIIRSSMDTAIRRPRNTNVSQTQEAPAAVISLEGGWLLLPLVAAVGGAWAYARPLFKEDPTRIAVAVGLILGGWLPWWRALLFTDWAKPLAQWKHWIQADPLPAWPYVQPGTPGEALQHRLSQARSWWHEVGRAALAPALRLALLGFAMSLLLGFVLGRMALLLSLAFMACTELAVLWHEGKGDLGAAWLALTAVGCPWLLGATLQNDPAGAAGYTAIALVLMVSFYASTSWISLLGPVIGAAFLVWQGKAVATGWLILLALPGLIVRLYDPTPRNYRYAIGPWIIAIVVLIALVL